MTTKKPFGIAEYLQPSSKIYYEGVYSQFQIGRITDLFCVIGFEKSNNVHHLRNALQLLLSEAFRFRAQVDSTIPSFEPANIEYSADEGRAVLGVSFTFDESFQDRLNALPNGPVNTDEHNFISPLNEVCKLSTKVILKIFLGNRRAEIVCIIPDLTNSKQLESEQSIPQTLIECIRSDEEADQAPPNDYVLMGDVSYMVDDSAGGEKVDNGQKLVEAATSEKAVTEAQVSHDIDQMIAKGTSHEDVIEALSHSLSGEQMAEVIKRNLSNEQVADLLAKANPNKIAEILAASLSEEEITKLVLDSLSDEMRAQALSESDPRASAEILRKTLSTEEIKKVIKNGTSEQEKAKLLTAADPKESAKILRKEMSREEISTLISESLPEEVQAQILADSLSTKEKGSILEESLSKEDKASLLASADPKAAGKLLKKNLKTEQVNELIESSLSDEKKAEALSADMSANEIEEIVSNHLTISDKARILSKVNPEKSAAILAKNLKEGELAKILTEELNSEEKAEILSGGMDKEEFVEFVKKNLPNGEKAKILAESDPQAFAETLKQSLSKEELAEMVRSGFSKEDMASTLIEGMSPEEVAQLVKGGMNDEDLAQLVKGSMPEDEFAQLIKGSLKEGELTRILKGGMSPEDMLETIFSGTSKEEKSKVIRAALSEKELNEVVKSGLLSNPNETTVIAAMDAIEPEQLKKLVAQGLQDKEFAQIFSTGLSPDQVTELTQMSLGSPELAKTLIASLPPEAVAQSLASTLSPEQLNKTVRECIPENEISMIISSALPREELADILGSTQMVLDNSQMNTLMKSDLSSAEMTSVFSTILPKDAIESVLSGSIPKADFIESLKSRLPYPEMASTIADKVFRDIKVSEDKPVPPQSHLHSPEKFKEAVDTRVAESKNAVEFYLARAKTLETQLRVAEEQKRKALQEADKTRLQLEKLLSESAGLLQKTIPVSKASTTEKPSFENRINASTTEPSENEYRLKAEAGFKDGDTLENGDKVFKKESHIVEPVVRTAQSSQAPVSFSEVDSTKIEVKDKVPDSTDKNATKDKVVSDRQTDDNSENPIIHRQKEALEFFQKKAQTFEADLRKAEQEVKRLSAEKKADLLKLATDSEQKQKQKTKGSAAVDQQVVSGQKSDLRDLESVVVADKQSAADSDDETTTVREDLANEPKKEAKSVQTLQVKVRDLETQLRNSETEKQKLLQQVREERHKATQANAALENHRDDDKGERRTETPAPKADTKQPEARAPKSAVLNQSEVPAVEENSVEVGESIERDAQELDEGLENVVKRIEKIKDDLPDEKAKKAVDGLMGQVMKEKALFIEKSKNLSAEMKKREFSFKNKEAAMSEELRQAQLQIRQKQAIGDRMKQAMVEMQDKITKGQASSSHAENAESQFRIKLEQSQTKVEFLTKEIEKLNKRAQQPAPNQAVANQQQKLSAEYQKQTETANKALLAKKQEVEILKKQITEKEAKETEYKRNLLKLQNELNAAKIAASSKKAG